MDILDDHQVNINFSNLIFAGVDTTSNVLQWMMLHIAQNPRVQAKLRAEAEAVLGGGNVASPKDYKALKYVKIDSMLSGDVRHPHRLQSIASLLLSGTTEW